MKNDVVIVGGGIVGLASALKLKLKNQKLQITLIEKEDILADHQTGNNSGVIHSGLYYKPGSMKAVNCINGYKQLIKFCDEENIKYDLCGKLVVATKESELPQLEKLFDRGAENGLSGFKKLNAEEIKEYEPHVKGLAGFYVPQTGIIDFREVANKYADKIKSLGGEIKTGEKVTGIEKRNGSTVVKTDKGEYETKLVVNCAGLYSDKVARFTQKDINVKIIPFRGEYYKLSKEKEYLVKNLIYPVPDPAFPFLGVHFTRMMRGGIEAGPNAVLAFAREGYSKSIIKPGEFIETLMWPGFQKVAAKYWKTGFGEMYRSFSKTAFTKALQELIPEIQSSDLVTGGAGVRAQACDREGGLLDDFSILESDNAVNVCNAPSPAATSSLAIGDTVSDIAIRKLAG